VAARKSPLRAVSPGEKAPGQPRTVTEAASKGTTRELLVTMRDRVAKDVQNENTPARDLAALTKRLMEIVRDIEAIDARAEQDARDGAAEVEDGEFDASVI
jgi:hypothetical protein